MPFISSIRRRYKPETNNIDSNFKITGGNSVMTAGGYRIHMFTSVGEHTFSVQSINNQLSNTLGLRTEPLTTEYLVIAGGAAGGNVGYGMGGGGAGGYQSGNLGVDVGSAPVTVGDGGPRDALNAGNSVFSSITSTGGGRGQPDRSGGTAQPGGSGGGGSGHQGGGGGGAGGSGGAAFAPGTHSNPNGSGASGIPGQGSGGGNGHHGWPGGNGSGGSGVSSSISGSAVTRAGGGSGGGHSPTHTSWSSPAGGPGGGGNGENSNPGSPNTGGGGGGNRESGGAGGVGGSGIVIVRYLI